MRTLPLALFLGWRLFAQNAANPDAAAVMKQVAANVEKSADERKRFVYRQKVHSALVRGSGEVARAEWSEYLAIPKEGGTEKKLDSFRGEYRKGKRMLPYTDPAFRYKEIDIDGDVLHELTEGLVNDKSSRDGVPRSLFPLRPSTVARYKFTMLGETEVKGRPAYKIAFEPLAVKKCVEIGGDKEGECESEAWKGEAWIDREELQPVRISTHLAFDIPLGVRVFLGTNLKQTGFSISYTRVAENVWFPATYGTEFWFNVLWGYRRTLTLTMDSDGFKKTDVSSHLVVEK